MNDDERDYLFDRYHFFNNAPSLRDAFSTPGFVDYDTEFILALGPKGTGIPLHFHTDSWLEVVAGSKQWWVYPPGTPVPFCSSLSQSTWAETHAHEDEVATFVQNVGDVVYVPEGW